MSKIINMRFCYLFICSLTFTLSSYAQNITITGIVKDKDSRQPVSYGSIALLNQKPAIGTKIDGNGRFKLNITAPLSMGSMVVSSIGFQSDTIKISSSKIFYEVLLSSSDGNLNEVVVTGVSRKTLARENPIPVISVSARKIEQATESNIIDVLVKNVPGLNAVKTGPNISKPFIRGLGYNRVLTLYDGIRQEGQQWGDEHGIEVDAYNIDRAEVVKGPSSLVYGSDALAGVVGLMPYMPADHDRQLKGKYFSEYQSNNGLIGNGLRLGYATEHWAYALRGSYRIAKNYTNSIDGRVYNSGFRETNASGSVKYSTDKGYSSINLTLYDNLQGIPDGSRDSLSRKFTKQIYEGDADDITQRPVVSDALLNSYQLSPLHQHIQHYRIYTKNKYRLGEGDLEGILAFQQNIRKEYNHPTQPEQAGMFVRLNTINYGLNYNAPAFAGMELSFGINGMYQNNISKDATDFPIPDYSLLDGGVYTSGKWKSDKWTISGGLRYDLRNLKAKDFYIGTDPVTGFDQRVLSGDLENAELQFPSFNKTFRGLSLGLGTTYQLNDMLSLKANIARGYRAPNITEFASNGLDPGAHIIYLGNRNFDPEFSLQQDLGAELATKDLSATLSIFNNNIRNYIYLTLLADGAGEPITDAQGNKTYQYQQAKAQLYGIEATFSLHPSVWKGFAFDNAFTLNYGFNRKSDFKGQETQGEYLPLIPPLHLLSSVSQEFKFQSGAFSRLNIKAEVDINAAQKRYLGLNNTETSTPGYTLVNLSAGTTIQYSKTRSLQFQFQVNNLFDLAYQSNLNRLKYFEYYSKSPNGHLGIYNLGRNISVKAIVPF